jgi:hypothetical protein
LSCSEGYADARDRTEWVGDEALAAMVAMWGTGELQHVLNPDMPWNDEIRATLARQERLAASPTTPTTTPWPSRARCNKPSTAAISQRRPTRFDSARPTA